MMWYVCSFAFFWITSYLLYVGTFSHIGGIFLFNLSAPRCAYFMEYQNWYLEKMRSLGKQTLLMWWSYSQSTTFLHADFSKINAQTHSRYRKTTQALVQECARGVAMHFLQSAVDVFGKKQTACHSHELDRSTSLWSITRFDSLHLSANPDQTQFHVEMCISMPWCYVRLLLLVWHAHNRSNKRCYLGRLPLDIIKMIAHFL